MANMVYTIVLLGLISTLVIAEVNITAYCIKNCFEKIPSGETCSRSCLQLVSMAGNDTGKGYILPVPDTPHLVSSTYTNITVAWTPGKYLLNGDAPVLYIVEIKRKRFVADPLAILPDYRKYHAVSNTSFTTPTLETKANYTMRVAAMTLNGTQGFSAFSPNLQTSNECKLHYNDTSNIEHLCAITNLRLVIKADLYIDMYLKVPKQRTNVWIDWDLPPEIHRLPPHSTKVEIEPLSSSKMCTDYGTITIFFPKFKDHIHLNKTEDAHHLKFYMGCRYRVNFKLRNIMNSNHLIWTKAIFSIPKCIGGICACADFDYRNFPPPEKTKSKYITIANYQPINNNITNVTVTWDEAPWQGKAVFFRIIIRVSFSMVLFKKCIIPHQDVFVNLTNKASKGTRHNITFTGNRLKQCSQYIQVKGYDRSGCHIPLQEVLLFNDYIWPTEQSTLSGNGSLATELPTTFSHVGILGKTASTRRDKTLITVAIVVPLIIILLVIFLVLFFVHKRLKGKPITCAQTPSGLTRLNDDNAVHFELSHVYHRNVDTESTFFGTNENSRLLVNLPPKCINGGLELNPAYVEQQIQEAIRLGDTDEYEFGFHRLVMGRILGKGAFGHVFIADAYGMNGNSDKTVVAVKILKDNATQDEKEDFRAEINFMKMIGKHENIITILGCCTLYEPVCLLVEYAPHGDLLHYLRDLRKKFEMEKRKCLSLQIESALTRADGLSLSNSPSTCRGLESPTNIRPRSISVSNIGRELLAIFSNQRRNSKEIDLLYVGRNEESNSTPPSETTQQTFETTLTVATNITKNINHSSPELLSLDGALDSNELESFAYQIACGMTYLSSKGVLHRDLAARNILVGEGKVLKISDFGLSREGIYVKRSNGKIPLRWLSLEAIRDRIYSMASDVWSFGIVLWEICTLGGFPYPTVNDRDLLKFLLDGQRMEKPSNCTDEIYHLMLACWSTNPEDRPSFQVLKDLLFDMEKNERPYVNVDPSQEISLPPDEGHVGNLIRFSDNSNNSFLNSDTSFPPNVIDNNIAESKDNPSTSQEPVANTQITIDDHSEDLSQDPASNNNQCEHDKETEPAKHDLPLNDISNLQIEITDDVDESTV